MAKLTRKFQKIFGGLLVANNNIAKFGSAKIGVPAYSLDPDDIQSTEYSNGWAAALINNKSPALQDMNALFNLITRQLAYQFQAGIPEYDATTTYYTGSIVNNGYGVIYRSLADDNTGNALSDSTKWVYTRSLARAGLITPYAGDITDAAAFRSATGWALCNGDTIVRATYADLFTNIGTAWDQCYNPLTGAQYSAPSGTDFRLPDLRGAFIRGVGAPTGLDAVTLAGYQSNKTKTNGIALTATNGLSVAANNHTHDGSGLYAMLGRSGSSTMYWREASGVSAWTATLSTATTIAGSSASRTEGTFVGGNTGYNSSGTTIGIGNGDSETRPNNVGVNYIIKLYNDIW